MDPPASQTSSHFLLEPVPASIFVEQETRRRDALRELGYCKTGYPELDDYVLLGGLEKGCVVGISAEDEEVGVQIGLQTLAHSLCSGVVRKGLIVTPKPANAILGGLRDSIKAELRDGEITAEEMAVRMRTCLDRVLISCVFDLDGLWEVLAELDKPASPLGKDGGDEEMRPMTEASGCEGEEKATDEIQDSEDDEALSPPPPTKKPALQEKAASHLPDIIIITHFSTLLTSLFTHREKSAAHNALQLLGSHLRYLTRNLSSSPLVLVLNSTISDKPYDDNVPRNYANTAPRIYDDTQKATDATLRSIFNPPPLGIPGYVTQRRNKPRFGLVFSQILDLHLLVTRLPRTKGDAEAVIENRPARYVWIVECLLDEMGVWEGKTGVRRSREQRWTGVDVVRGRLVNGLDELVRKADVSDVRLAGGFGGRRV